MIVKSFLRELRHQKNKIPQPTLIFFPVSFPTDRENFLLLSSQNGRYSTSYKRQNVSGGRNEHAGLARKANLRDISRRFGASRIGDMGVQSRASCSLVPFLLTTRPKSDVRPIYFLPLSLPRWVKVLHMEGSLTASCGCCTLTSGTDGLQRGEETSVS